MSLSIVVQCVLLLGLSFILVAGLTEVARRVAIYVGFVSKPVGDRWCQRSVPMGGGIAIQLGWLALLFVWDRDLFLALGPIIGLLMLFGLVDDLVGFMPWTKLGFQTLIAWYAITHGYKIVTPWDSFSNVASIFWILFITNAVNLTDNMDGLSSGLVAVASLGLVVFFVGGANSSSVTLSIITLGAALGFLMHNRYPARIFMGDAGSLPFGFILSLLAIKVQNQASPESFSGVFQMFSILIVPLFDSIFVMSRRALAGLSIMRGNIDHTSHRLVKAGLNDRQAVGVLYALGVMGVIGLFLLSRSPEAVWVPLVLAGVLLTLSFAAFLIRAEKGPVSESDFGLAPLRLFIARMAIPATTFVGLFSQFYASRHGKT